MASAASTALTVNVDRETAAAVDRLAARMARPSDEVLSEAISEWVVEQERELAAIEAGLADAEAGRFASDEEVERVFAKYIEPQS